jgi:hypothetical protein
VPSAATIWRVMPAQVGVGPGQVRAAGQQVLQQRPKALRVEHGQGVGGRRAGQTTEVELAVEVAAALDEAQRAGHGVEEGQQQSEDELVEAEGAVAVGGPFAQALQVLLEQGRREGQRPPPVGVGGRSVRRYRQTSHGAGLCQDWSDRAS